MLIHGDSPHNDPTPPWLIEGWVPRTGVVLLYGKKGVGKSPVTWALAEAVATHGTWLGLPVRESGSVLYVEADTPALVVRPRMHRVLQSHAVSIFFPAGQSLAPGGGWEQLQHESHDLDPVLVVVNTLRRAHDAKDTDSNVPSRVYARFQRQWSRACLLFVHHEKKTPTDPAHQLREGEEFSGSLAWANDAQVVLRLGKPVGRPPEDGGSPLTLRMEANQLGPIQHPIRLALRDGIVA